MDIPVGLAWMLVVLGVILFVFAVITWILLYDTLTEARAHFRRQNAAGRLEDDEADEWERQNPGS